MGLVEEQLLPEMYPALYQFQQALQFNCKPVSSYLLSGRGKHANGRSYHQTPQEYVDTHNFHPRTITKSSPPGHICSGVIKEDVQMCIEMCMEEKAISIHTDKLCGFICCISTDEMALKPALEYSHSHRTVVGLVEPQELSYDQIQEFQTNEEILTYLDTHEFVIQAREVRVASCDDTVNFRLVCFTVGAKVAQNL